MTVKRVTIRDVAKKANVSVSTVSRVLRKYDNVPKETEEIVMKAVKELNYIPNVVAQSMTQGSMKTIGIVFTRTVEDAFDNPFFGDILRGISHVASKYGYHMQLLAFANQNEEKEECMSLLKSGRIDGLILLSSRTYDILIHELLMHNMPFVLSGRVIGEEKYKERLYSVNTDNIMDSYKITKHLIHQGHNKIAFINGPLDYVVNVDRYQGFRRALMESGIAHDTDLEINGGYTMEDAKIAIEEKLKYRRDITAIFAKDDLKAVSAIQVIKKMGKCVPKDIAVAGYNDYNIASIIEPNLTTIRVPVFDLGVKAATMLIHRLIGEKIDYKNVILTTELIERESTNLKIR